MAFQPRHGVETERAGLLSGDDEAGTVQLDAGTGNQVVRHQRLDCRDVGADLQVAVDPARSFPQFDNRGVRVQPALPIHCGERPLPLTTRGHGHGDAHRCLVRRLQPGVVGHGVDQGQWPLPPRMPFGHTAREGLGHGVGGDEAEAAQRIGLAFRRLAQQARGRFVPEMHDEIGAAGHLWAGLPRRFGVAIAQFGAHVLAADEGWVAHDELGFRPVGRARFLVTIEFHRGVGIGNFLARDRVALHGRTVPAGERPSLRVAQQFLFVVGQDRVLLLDCAVGVQNRFADALGRDGTKLPLQKADPQHEIGDGDGAGVDLQAVELARTDRPHLPSRGAMSYRQDQPVHPAPRLPAVSSTPARHRRKLPVPQAGSSTRVVQSR